MASKNVSSAPTPLNKIVNRPKGLVREPAYSVKEVCDMYGITHSKFAGLASHHPIQAALNVGRQHYRAGKGKAVYSKSVVVEWATRLGLVKV